MKPLLMVVLIAACAASATRWRYNAPRAPWTNYEQEFTRHPDPYWGYGGINSRPLPDGKFHDGVYRND